MPLIDAELGVARDDHAGGDHGPAVIDRGHRDRQLVEVDVPIQEDHLAGGRGLEVFGRDRAIDRLLQLVLDLPIGLAAERHDGALARADDAGHHRHVVAGDVVEEERGLGLVHQGRDMADIHRLMQVDDLRSAASGRGTGGNSPASVILRKAPGESCWGACHKLLRSGRNSNPDGNAVTADKMADKSMSERTLHDGTIHDGTCRQDHVRQHHVR